MKKNLKLASVVLASMLVLAACGKTESVEASVSETSTEASVEASVETSVEASVEELVEEVVEEEEKEVASVEEEIVAEGEVAEGTLEDYFAKNEAEYKAMKAQEASVEGLTIDVKGNVVVYTYALPIEVDEATAPTYAAAFAEQMASDSASVKQLTDAIKMVEQGSGIDGIVFALTYLDSNNVEVYSCKLDANGVIEE